VARLLRRERDDRPQSSWSPFAHNDGPDSEAVAQALLAAVEHEDCPLGELTPGRYSELRHRRPQMGLPRATTLTAVCGSWGRAVEAAECRASRAIRGSRRGPAVRIAG
jgi:hypothetical protein